MMVLADGSDELRVSSEDQRHEELGNGDLKAFENSWGYWTKQWKKEAGANVSQ